MAAIDVGSHGGTPNTAFPSGWTMINRANPANASGVINKATFKLQANATGIKIATFIKTNGTTYTARHVVLLGDLAAAEYTLHSINDLTIVAGDYIGIYATGGTNPWHLVAGGGSGYEQLIGDQTACSEAVFATGDADADLYVYGEGATPAVGGGAGMGIAEAIFAGEL